MDDVQQLGEMLRHRISSRNSYRASSPATGVSPERGNDQCAGRERASSEQFSRLDQPDPGHLHPLDRRRQ